MKRRLSRLVFAVCFGVIASTGIVLGHGSGGLRLAAPERVVVPTWLYVVTGGGVVGVSFLLASLFTDRDLLEELHTPYGRLTPNLSMISRGAAGVGIAALVLIVVTGFVSPNDPLQNPAILLVWVGWWAGFTMLVYLVGNAWPALDPFRTIARLLPVGTPRRQLSTSRASWLGAFGLLTLFGVEVVSPIAESGPNLVLAVVAYLAITLLGTHLIGFDTWFDHVDPISRTFRLYGGVAPIGRNENGVVYRLPAAGLAEALLEGQGGVAFVVALVWGTTFDGLVTTPTWAGFATTVVKAGVPPLVLYLGVLILGFGFFLGVYRVASRLMRRTAPTYLSADTLARRFAPSLVAIAAGYHLAHNLTYFLGLLPAIGASLLNPLSTGPVPTLVFPSWVTYLPFAFVLLGHLGAVLVAHAVTFELFAGRLQAIRSQYPLTGVMIVYTMTSLWIVSQPTVTPPYL